MNRGRWVALIVMVALGVAPWVAEATGHGYLLPVLTRVAIYGLAAMSLDLILAYGGLVSFGHAAFLGLGAYTVGVLSQHWFYELPIFGAYGDWMNQALIVWPLAMMIAAGAALVIGAISLRTRGVYFIMITLAFAQMLYFVFVSLEPYGGDDGLSLWWGPNALGTLDLTDRMTMFYVAFVLLAAGYLLLWRIVHARFGRVLRGLQQNELRMRALGYRPLPYQLTAFALSGAIAGLAGAMLANQTGFVSPGVLHWSRSGELMVMVILGGMGSLVGSVLGAGTLLLLEESLVSITEHWQLALGPILVLVVLFARRGIAGWMLGRDHRG